MLATIGQIHAAMLRPFSTRVDLETVVLLLLLLIVASGMHHMIIERVEL